MRRLGLHSERALVQLHVLLGGAPPGEVLLHPATDQSLPLFLIAIDLQREQYRAQDLVTREPSLICCRQVGQRQSPKVWPTTVNCDSFSRT